MSKEKLILVTCQKGGVGKTTIVDELAFWCDRKGIPANVWDMDGQGGSAYVKKDDWKPNDAYKDLSISILDTPGELSSTVISSMKEADLIIVPINLSPRDIDAFTRTIEVVHRNKKKAKVIYVLNRWNTRRVVAKEFFEWFVASYPNEKYVLLPESQLFINAAMDGKSVVKYSPSSQPALKVKELLNMVEESLGI